MNYIYKMEIKNSINKNVIGDVLCLRVDGYVDVYRSDKRVASMLQKLRYSNICDFINNIEVDFSKHYWDSVIIPPNPILVDLI